MRTEREARRVEQLVGQCLPLLDLLRGVAHVLGGGHRKQAEAHRVGAVDGRSPRNGSMPVPSDLDMRRPSGAWITEWM